MTNIETFKFWCHKVLPLVYDDSLSYYELLCKVVDKLNEVINKDNTTSEAVNELKKYVDNYFSSTDFTSKVNERLDEMAVDGTFDKLFEKYSYHNHIKYPYHNVYLNRITGDDNNDGLSQNKAFKTLDRALKEANNWGDFRIWIYGSGEYDWTEPCLNGVTLHIIDKVGDVRINCVPTKKVSMCIYNSHINIAGYSDTKLLELYVPQSFNDYNQVVYFENCATAIKNVHFNSNYRFDTFGGYIRFEGKFKINGEMAFVSTDVDFSANVDIMNTKNNLALIQVLRGCNFSINAGTWTWNSLSADGTSVTSRAIHCHSSNIFINRNISSVITHKYYTALSATHCNILFANARISLFADRLGTHGNNFVHCVVNGVLESPDP